MLEILSMVPAVPAAIRVHNVACIDIRCALFGQTWRRSGLFWSVYCDAKKLHSMEWSCDLLKDEALPLKLPALSHQVNYYLITFYTRSLFLQTHARYFHTYS